MSTPLTDSNITPPVQVVQVPDGNVPDGITVFFSGKTMYVTLDQLKGLLGAQNGTAATITLDVASSGSVGVAFPVLAQVTPGSTPIAKVEFFADGVKIGQANTSPYAISYVSLSLGTFALSAKATDTNGVAVDSAAVKVKFTRVLSEGNQPPTVSLVLTPATIVLGDSTTLNATASDPEGLLARVDFYDGTELLKTLTSSPFVYIYTPTTKGQHVITAKAYDAADVAVEAKKTLTVNPVVVITPGGGGGGTTPPTPPTFDTTLTGPSQDEATGTRITSSAADLFKFNVLPIGAADPRSMYLLLPGQADAVALIDYLSPYDGAAFSYQPGGTGTIYYGHFADGNVTLSTSL